MLGPIIRAARPQLARAAARTVARRSLTASAVRSDIIKDLYLNELRQYKPTPIKAGDAEGQVLKFAVPATPATPEEAGLVDELAAYESQTVEVDGQTADESGVVASPAELDDWFEELEEEGEPAH